jgi:hypothetical protein
MADRPKLRSRVGLVGLVLFAGITIGVLLKISGATSSGRGSVSALSAPFELVFPSAPGASGTDFPEHGCGDFQHPTIPNCGQLSGFDRSDYEGIANNNGVNERMQWVADPSGSGKTVAQFEVYGDDSADTYGGTRAAIFETGPNSNDGKDGWFSFGVYIPVGFQYPNSWFLLMQNKDAANNPVQDFELLGAGCASSAPRNHICWRNRGASNTTLLLKDLGLVQQGHWFYLTDFIQFRTTAVGSIKVWSSFDVKPNVAGAPQVSESNIITQGGTNNRSHILLYRGASAHTEHQVVYFCGFHRATTSAVAQVLSNCPAV